MSDEKRKTTIDDWCVYYGSRTKSEGSVQRPADKDFRNLPHFELLNTIGSYFRMGDLIEVGAGDSALLVDVALRYKPTRSVGLDYLVDACRRLKNRAQQANAEIEVICSDLFDPGNELVGTFDLVMSHGVVEHFTDLSGVIEAISLFAKPKGIVFTLIPNIKGSVYKYLMKKWDRKIYNAHVPYDVKDLMVAHQQAGLRVLECRYFMSSNFGMLSWCFVNRNKSGLTYWSYVQLTRVSKFLWWWENRFGLLPATRMFAPYIICVAQKD
jgi:2-polyprenyl-3-methyl-5-hydroxy-6-metoxy-1,4-benzoquinol methylase